LLKETEVGENIHPDAVTDDRPKGAADAEVATIINEKLMSSNSLDVAETVQGASMDGTDRVGESEV
jgi:hypothetical protein